MKKLLISLALAALVLTAFADTVKIGVILPLTGNNAKIGQMVLPAIDLFKETCATNPTNHHQYEIIVEDDQAIPRLTAQAINKLANIDHVDALVSFGSGSGHVVPPIAERKGIPHICDGSDVSISATHPYNFIHWVSPASQAQGFAQMMQQLGKKSVAIIVFRQQGMNAIAKALEEELPRYNIKIVSISPFNPGERDFRMMLTKIREQNPEAIVPLALSPEIEILLRQAHELGLTQIFPSVESYDFIRDLSLAEGQYYVSASLGTPAFRALLKEQTGAESKFALPFLYDSLDFFYRAYESSPTIDHSSAYRYITSIKDYPSVVGPVSCDQNRNLDSPAALFQIDHGQIVPVTLDEIK
jgi:branched-chain amino acid transport system substrate-binding protein